MSLDEWAQGLQRDVFHYWKENHSDWEHGVKIFYGPVEESSEILILGYQPGGDESSFISRREQFESGDFSLPEVHEYLSADWRLAREMRTLFAGNDATLERSVKTNINFFRAPDINYWEANLPKRRRDDMESFCFARIEEIIERIEPSVIVAEGIRTWDELKHLFDLKTSNSIKRDQARLVCISEEENPKTIGLMHPSGARISNEDKDRMRTKLLDTLATHTSYEVNH